MTSRIAVRWQLVGWLFLLSTIAYLDRVNMSIAADFIDHDYGFTRQQFGWILSAFVFGYMLCQAPAGRIADLLGPRRTLAFGAVWWAVLTSASAAVPGGPLALVFFLVVRFALGAGEAVMYPASNRVVAVWIPVAERGLATGLIFTGVGIGTAVAAPLVTAVMLRFQWRTSFPICGALGLAVGFLWYLVAHDTPAEHRGVTSEEREVIRDGVPPSVAAPPLAWRAILRDRNVALLTLSYFCYGYAAYIFFSWFYVYLTDARGLDLRTSAWYGMLPGLGMAIGSGCGGWLNDRVTKRFGRRVGRCGVASAALMLAAVFIALGPTVVSARLASVVLAGGVAALYLAQSSFWSVSADIAGPSAGAVSGVMNMGAQLGGVVTASLTPWIGDHYQWSACFFVAAALCVLGAIAWLVVRPQQEIRGTGSW